MAYKLRMNVGRGRMWVKRGEFRWLLGGFQERDFEGILWFFFKEWVVIHEERFLQSFKVVVDGFFQLVVSPFIQTHILLFIGEGLRSSILK